MPCTWPRARSAWTMSRMKSRGSSLAVTSGIGFLSFIYLSTSTRAHNVPQWHWIDQTSGGTTIGTYTSDCRGRRTSKTVSGTTTIYVTDADNREVLEYDGSTGAIQRWYAYG